MGSKTPHKLVFKDFVDHLQKGIYRSTDGLNPKFVFVNKTFSEMFGFDTKQCGQILVEDIFADKRTARRFHRLIKQEGFVRDFEARLKNKKRKQLWGTLSAVAVRNEKGRVQFFDVVVSDISLRKKAEEEMAESRKLFQTVFNHTAAAITVTDKHEKIIAWNPYAEQLLGMTKADLFNKPVKELYPDKEWRRIRSFRIRKKGILPDIDTQLYKKDRTLLDINVSITVLKDNEGQVLGSIGIIRDITKQKKAERQLKDSENKIRVILDNSAAAITLTDAQERIISWNKYTEELLGMKKKELLFRPVKTLYPPEEWKRIRSEHIRKKGSKHHLETKVIRQGGEVIDVDLSVNILQDEEGKVSGSVGIMQDITDQKRFQEMLLQAKLDAEEANSTKSLFLANMSHEVRTPMNTILGMVDLTLDTELTSEQLDNLKVVKEAADNLLGLLNDILDLSRVESGKIVLENIEINLPNIVHSICKGMSVLAKDKKLELVTKIHPHVPELILGDPVRLRQILVNLINNAIKFTPKGKITTEVKTLSSTENEIMLLFSVTDEGIGIPRNRQEKVFDVFTQADSTTTRRFGGTGLGLAICKRLVEMMGGHIWVQSDEGVGSKFSFTGNFRVVKKARGAIAGRESTEAPAFSAETLKKEWKNLTLLLAEDNVVNQKIAVRILEKQGWTVDAVENGQDVLSQLDKKAYNLLLLDAQMPLLDGFETTKMIREREKQTGKHLPIIALTARAMDEDRKKCLDVGMDGYVPKPIDRKKLFEEIGSLLKKRKKHE